MQMTSATRQVAGGIEKAEVAERAEKAEEQQATERFGIK